MTAAPNTGAQLTLADITKRFAAVHALCAVTLTMNRGEVHGLVGENGAGKSTLGKIIAGVISPDSGEIHLDGRPVRYSGSAAALRDGVTIIAQELALVPRRTVAENVLLGVEPRQGIFIDQKRVRRQYAELDERAGFGLPADAPVGSLRKSDQQKVEILRALARGARLIVMDEPTAALGSDESKQLVAITRQLAAEGCTIVFISHFLSEVLQVCDRVSVLRDGQLVRTGTARDETPESLVTSMIGRAVNVTFPHKTQPENAGEPVLEVKGLNSRSGLRNVDLKLWPGEILGIAGLVGSGRSELARAIFGVDSYDGTVEVQGKPVTLRSARQAVDAGIAMLPESRKELGLVLGRSVAENVTLPHLSKMDRWSFVRRGREAQAVSAVLAGVGVREGVTDLAVDNLSGGNQQKVMFAKWLVRSPKIFIADEPTQGVDVGAKAMIYDLIVGLAAKGMAVILISSELEEVVGLAHRVLVMRNGEIVNEFSDLTAAKDDILSHAFGTKLAVR